MPHLAKSLNYLKIRLAGERKWPIHGAFMTSGRTEIAILPCKLWFFGKKCGAGAGMIGPLRGLPGNA
jgi:hypothetical protein